MQQTTRALLVTDVVESTKLTEKLGDERVAELWAAHDRLARDLLAAHEGREIDKTDGFLLLFDEAKDAVAYALDYHRGLTELGLSARAGLHVGAVSLRENSAADVARGAKPLEVEGLAKPIAARTMSVAQGGQTLATSAAIATLDIRRATPGPDGHVQGDGLLAVTHGHWMLKGVLRPLELFEVGVPGEAPLVPPPDAQKAWRVQWKNEAWVPVRAVKHSLPRERDAFVGREEDLHALADRLDGGAALVSVLGIGGTGKTRLVTHFGWTWLGDWPGGIWFCDLSEARSVDGIASAVGRALDVPLGEDAITQLGHAIAGHGRCLVVLDNFEQVARHAKDTLGRWLDRATDAQFVVTTREVLGLRGETTLALAPLDDTDGHALFRERARQASRDFALSAEDEASVEELVQLLDGLPLAIELAAARVRVMAPTMLLERMAQRFRLLTSTGGRRDRQATLRAALDWSWDLLSSDEQAALAQLSVFQGGFTLEAAVAVLDLGELWPEDAIQALVDKSLVRRVAHERFALLVSVQEYAAERLDASSARAAAETRHGKHFAGLGSDAALEALDVHGGVARRWALAADLANLVVATRRAIARGDGALTTAALKAAWAVLQLRGPSSAAADLADAALEIGALAPHERASVALVRGNALGALGRVTEAREDLEEALAIFLEAGNRRAACQVLSNLGNLLHAQGRRKEAQAHYEQALGTARDVGDRRLEGGVLANLGILNLRQGKPDEARAYYDRALAVNREVGNRRFQGIVLGNLGTVHMQQGRLDEARTHFDSALEIHREVGNRRFEGIVLGNLGILNLDEGRLEDARTHYERALTLHREVGNRAFEGIALANLGILHRVQGRAGEALAHLDRALAVAREVGDRAGQGGILSSLAGLHLSEDRRAEARTSFDAGEALLREVGDGAALGSLLCGRARLEHAEEHHERARATLAEAQALAEQVGAGPESELGKELAEALAELGARHDG